MNVLTNKSDSNTDKPSPESSDIKKIHDLVMTANSSDTYFDICDEIAKELNPKYHEQLIQLVNGPIYDGDVIDKSLRTDLIGMGLAVRVCCNGEQGFTGATYTAYTVAKRLE